VHLEVSVREREGIMLLDLKGRITAGPEATAFREACQKVAGTPPQAILNMMHVDYVDSTGLGAMVLFANNLRNAGGVGKLVHLNRRNLELLVLTRIDTIFEVFEDETDAVNSFFPDREIKRFDILSFVQKLRSE
jgi:anti-sigma B factor antagonist